MATKPASENPFPEVLLSEVAAPAAAPTGKVRLYAKSDGLLYWKDDAGTEYPVGADISAHTGDTTDAHDASAISADTTGYGNSAGADVQTVLDDFDAAISAAGGGGGGTVHEDFWTPPDSAGTFDQEFDGTADTLPSGFSWTTQPSGSNNWKLNSQWKRCLVINRAALDTTTFDLRYAMAPGAIDIGFWWYMDIGMGRWNNNAETIEVLFRDSSGNAGFGMQMIKTSVLAIGTRDRTGGVTSNVVFENASNNDTRMGVFCGVTRKASDNTWRGYISGDGRTWESLNVSTTRSVTIDHMQATFTSGGNNNASRYIFGPIRSRADLLHWAPR